MDAESFASKSQSDAEGRSISRKAFWFFVGVVSSVGGGLSVMEDAILGNGVCVWGGGCCLFVFVFLVSSWCLDLCVLVWLAWILPHTQHVRMLFSFVFYQQCVWYFYK